MWWFLLCSFTSYHDMENCLLCRLVQKAFLTLATMKVPTKPTILLLSLLVFLSRGNVTMQVASEHVYHQCNDLYSYKQLKTHKCIYQLRAHPLGKRIMPAYLRLFVRFIITHMYQALFFSSPSSSSLSSSISSSSSLCLLPSTIMTTTTMQEKGARKKNARFFVCEY